MLAQLRMFTTTYQEIPLSGPRLREESGTVIHTVFEHGIGERVTPTHKQVGWIWKNRKRLLAQSVERFVHFNANR